MTDSSLHFDRRKLLKAAAVAVILTVLVSILVAIYQRVLKAGGQHAEN